MTGHRRADPGGRAYFHRPSLAFLRLKVIFPVNRTVDSVPHWGVADSNLAAWHLPGCNARHRHSKQPIPKTRFCPLESMMKRGDVLMVGALLVAAKPGWSLAQGSGSAKARTAHQKMTAAIWSISRTHSACFRSAPSLRTDRRQRWPIAVSRPWAHLQADGSRFGAPQEYATSANASIARRTGKVVWPIEREGAAPNKVVRRQTMLAISEEFLKNAQAVTQN